MSKKVFISFRFSDGNKYKDYLSALFAQNDNVINCSEDEDRSNMSEETIKKYLYDKLRNTSLTIVILTPQAINHQKKYTNYGYKYDDWMYDEIKYSLDDREGNRCNGLIAIYTPEAKNLIIDDSNSNGDGSKIIKDFDNLVRKNMFNIKPRYKHNEKNRVFDSDYDHYCSLISWTSFINNYDYYISIASSKREKTEQYDIKKRL